MSTVRHLWHVLRNRDDDTELSMQSTQVLSESHALNRQAEQALNDAERFIRRDRERTDLALILDETRRHPK